MRGRSLYLMVLYDKLEQLTYFSFLIRYLVANYMISTATLVFEIMRISYGDWRQLLVSQLIFMFIGLSMIVFFNILLLCLILYVTVRTPKIKDTDRIYTLLDGLNSKNRLWVILYYTWYLGLRYIVLLLLGITAFLPSLALWIMLLVT